METKRFHARSRALLFLLAGVLTAYIGVLYQLQVVNGGLYLEQSTRKIVNTETVQSVRGNILDRYGRPLTTNRTTYQVSLDEKLMGSDQNRNNILLSLVNVCREQRVSCNDSFPVYMSTTLCYTVDSPFETVTRKEDGTETRSKTQL
ncbi:MAG: hypothetical protein K2F83_04365, partial [Oscillospiraceae bacterium]|nr:hypothetical protein [Oscillospiraceae bacterium]